MLASWHKQFPEVEFSLFELNEREILTGIEERRLEVALMTKHAFGPGPHGSRCTMSAF